MPCSSFSEDYLICAAHSNSKLFCGANPGFEPMPEFVRGSRSVAYLKFVEELLKRCGKSPGNSSNYSARRLT
jgi:hypothetical protein